MRCLDCGNKAKKDCVYYRCRSCCKGHGFQCQTHIKSTWVPISTRKVIRNSVEAISASRGATQLQEHHQREQQLLCLPSVTGLGGHFPTEVSGETTFTCIHATTNLEEYITTDQYAYEASISINGHVFKGILYDQGPYQPIVNSRDMNVHDGA